MMNELLHKNLAASANQFPDQDAFRCGQQSLTYADLERRSSQLAACLQESGVGRGDRVGIRLAPGIEASVAVYGILKTGAAFVPIDPHAPAERLIRILNTGRIRHLVTTGFTETLRAAVVEACPALQFLISAESSATDRLKSISWTAVETFGATFRSRPIDGSDPAYVIFTSGSTGVPKGIVHTHDSGQSYARLSVAEYAVTERDRIASPSPLHFDMSTFGYLSAVKAGATTVLIPEAYLKLPASLSQLLQDESVSIWYSVPFLLIQLSNRGAMDQRDLSSLRWVMFGGEPFPPRHLYKLMEVLPAAQFSNVYGPAEVNQCTRYTVPAGFENRADANELPPIPIGKVWAETDALIVDADDKEVLGEQPGELLVHSSTMMSDYWETSLIDSNVFYQADGGSLQTSAKRYYRTGDLVSRDSEGILLFLGRKDRQVKIRGHRIELDEIEHALVSHPSVVEAAVLLVNDHGDVQHMHAGVTLGNSDTTTAEDLRAWLLNRLPHYAVPLAIEICQAFPRTTSGKIDRNRLQNKKHASEAVEARI